MAQHTRVWDALSKTDPKHTKKFKRPGGFEGTAVKPMACIRRMTEEFGPCGEGWGMDRPQFTLTDGINGEKLVYCVVTLWWKVPTNVVYGVGGDRVIVHTPARDRRPERLHNDDEAFKKAYTDALMNAMKHLGVAADVHMGLYDDSKYIREVAAEFGEGEKQGCRTPEAATKPEPTKRQQAPAAAKTATTKPGTESPAEWVDRQINEVLPKVAAEEGANGLHTWATKFAKAQERLHAQSPALSAKLTEAYHEHWNACQPGMDDGDPDRDSAADMFP